MTDKSKIYLSFLLQSFAFMETLDELKDTTAYRHRVKMLTNSLVKEMEGLSRYELSRAFGVDDETLFKLMDYQKNMLSLLAGMRVEDWEVVRIMAQADLDDKDRVMEMFGVKIEGEGSCG